jgi:hypothetical protein
MRPLLALAVLVLAASALAAPGTFAGELIPPPAGEDDSWLYVKGRNSMVRRVAFVGARVFYSDAVAQRDRRPDPSESLVPGAAVRVTADQNADGEWHATEVEITGTAAPKREAHKVGGLRRVFEAAGEARPRREDSRRNTRKPVAFPGPPAL